MKDVVSASLPVVSTLIVLQNLLLRHRDLAEDSAITVIVVSGDLNQEDY